MKTNSAADAPAFALSQVHFKEVLNIEKLEIDACRVAACRGSQRRGQDHTTAHLEQNDLTGVRPGALFRRICGGDGSGTVQENLLRLWVEYDLNLRSRGISPPQHDRDDADELGRRLSIHDSLRRAARSEQLGLQRSHSDHPATPSRAAALAGIGDLLSYSERPAGAGCGSGFR